MTCKKGSEQGALFAPPEDFEKQLENAYQEGRRAGLGEATRAVRIEIDARFRLQPGDPLDLSELPNGLDIGEILDKLNSFLIEYGQRCFRNGVQLREFMAEQNRTEGPETEELEEKL